MSGFNLINSSDERGFSFGVEGLGPKNLHVVSIRPGFSRGDHFHEYTEAALIIGGKDAALVEVGDERFIVKEEFRPVLFPPFVRHRIENIGNKEFYLVCFEVER